MILERIDDLRTKLLGEPKLPKKFLAIRGASEAFVDLLVQAENNYQSWKDSGLRRIKRTRKRKVLITEELLREIGTKFYVDKIKLGKLA